MLLVEDEEPCVRRLPRRSCASAATRCSRRRAAPRRSRSPRACGEPIDLLVTDVVMPGMKGPEVAGRSVAARPGLQVLYVSGYADEVLGPREDLLAQGTLLLKPFSPETLSARVRELLDGSGSGSGEGRESFSPCASTNWHWAGTETYPDPKSHPNPTYPQAGCTRATRARRMRSR